MLRSSHMLRPVGGLLLHVAHDRGDFLWVGNSLDADFQLVLTGAGDGDVADTQQAFERRLVDLQIADVAMANFTCLAGEQTAAEDRSLVGDLELRETSLQP